MGASAKGKCPSAKPTARRPRHGPLPVAPAASVAVHTRRQHGGARLQSWDPTGGASDSPTAMRCIPRSPSNPTVSASAWRCGQAIPVSGAPRP